MSSPISLRYIFPPGSIRAIGIYGLCLGLFGVVRYLGLSDFFFSKEVMGPLMIVAAIFGPIVIICNFHPEWRDWSRDDNNFGGD
jgi:hypothetical protein